MIFKTKIELIQNKIIEELMIIKDMINYEKEKEMNI